MYSLALAILETDVLVVLKVDAEAKVLFWNWRTRRGRMEGTGKRVVRRNGRMAVPAGLRDMEILLYRLLTRDLLAIASRGRAAV